MYLLDLPPTGPPVPVVDVLRKAYKKNADMSAAGLVDPLPGNVGQKVCYFTRL